MRIVCEQTLDRFRGPGLCEHCRKQVAYREPHHLLARGHNAGRRLDVSLNLMALGDWQSCACHAKFHDGNLPRCDLIACLSQREGLVFSEQEWHNAMSLFVRAPKNPDRVWFLKEVLDWTSGERLLVIRTLREIGIA